MSYTLHTDKTWSATQKDLDEQFRMWGVTKWQTNYPTGARREGYKQALEDRAVTLSYWKDDKEVLLHMDKQDRAVDNLRVLFLAIEAMRLNEKRGIADTIQSAYLQISAPVQFNPYAVLGLSRGLSLAVYEAQYKELAKQYHPDNANSGSIAKMEEINQAIDFIREELK